MDANEQYSAAVARCEATARDRGHTLDVWYLISEELRASVCVICGAMVWLSQPGQEKRWRVGGAALEQECLGEYRRVEPGIESGSLLERCEKALLWRAAGKYRLRVLLQCYVSLHGVNSSGAGYDVL